MQRANFNEGHTVGAGQFGGNGLLRTGDLSQASNVHGSHPHLDNSAGAPSETVSFSTLGLGASAFARPS